MTHEERSGADRSASFMKSAKNHEKLTTTDCVSLCLVIQYNVNFQRFREAIWTIGTE